MKFYSGTGEQMRFGEYRNDKPLMLVPYPNGGWTIQQEDHMRISAHIGAYSNTDDLLLSLDLLLNPKTDADPEARK